MSVRAMAHVWATSVARGTELLVALAIADFADDDGRAWPSIATLSRKARCAERTVQDSVAALRRRGELLVEVGAGPRGTNLFRVVLGGVQNPHPPQNAAGGGADSGNEGVRPAAPKPSVNHQRTTTTPRARARVGAASGGGKVVVVFDDGSSVACRRDWADALEEEVAQAAGIETSKGKYAAGIVARWDNAGAPTTGRQAADRRASASASARAEAEARRQARLAESAAKVQAEASRAGR